jgi:hypothetical protein
MSYGASRRQVLDPSVRLSDRHVAFRACLERFAFMTGESFRATYARLAAAHGFDGGRKPNEEQLLAAMEELDAERRVALDRIRETSQVRRAAKVTKREVQRSRSIAARSAPPPPAQH